MATSREAGPPEVCFGFGIHRSPRLNPRFSPGATREKDLPEACFSPRNREEFRGYVEDSLTPLAEVVSGWLDLGVHCSFSVSGTLCEFLSRFAPEGLDLLRQITSHSHSELLGETYYRSVAGLFPDLSSLIAGPHALPCHGGAVGVTPRSLIPPISPLTPNWSPPEKAGFLAAYTEGFNRFSRR